VLLHLSPARPTAASAARSPRAQGLPTIRAYGAGPRFRTAFLQQLSDNGAWWFCFLTTGGLRCGSVFSFVCVPVCSSHRNDAICAPCSPPFNSLSAQLWHARPAHPPPLPPLAPCLPLPVCPRRSPLDRFQAGPSGGAADDCGPASHDGGARPGGAAWQHAPQGTCSCGVPVFCRRSALLAREGDVQARHQPVHALRA
jgi:hypothetical protein